MTSFSCWLLPSFVPPKGLKLDHRRSWSSILLSMRRGRGTWCTTLTGWCILRMSESKLSQKQRHYFLDHSDPHISSYGIKTSPRTSPTTPSRRNMPHIPQQILFFDARSEPFLSENLRWTNTKEFTSVSWTSCRFVSILQEKNTKKNAQNIMILRLIIIMCFKSSTLDGKYLAREKWTLTSPQKNSKWITTNEENPTTAWCSSHQFRSSALDQLFDVQSHRVCLLLTLS